MSHSLATASAFPATGAEEGDTTRSQECHTRGIKSEHFSPTAFRRADHAPRRIRPERSPAMTGRPPQAASPLGPTEHAVLEVLINHAGRVVSRQNLVRMARIGHLSPRRCDTAIVSLRRMLGSTAIQTVRSRGWMLLLSALDEANKLL